MWWWWLVFCLRGVEKGMPRMPTESTGGKERKEPCTTEREQRRCLGTWQQRKDGTRLRNWFTLNIEEVKWKRAECWVGTWELQESGAHLIPLIFSTTSSPLLHSTFHTSSPFFFVWFFFFFFGLEDANVKQWGVCFGRKKINSLFWTYFLLNIWIISFNIIFILPKNPLELHDTAFIISHLFIYNITCVCRHYINI